MKLKQVFDKKKNEEEQQIEIIKNSESFDAKWYLEKNPDVKARRMGAARHYLKNGWKENRNPSPKFNNHRYLKKYPECKICPLVFEHNRNSYVDLAICAIMKNEGPYVKEWIDYHRMLGVKRFYIYDNESTDNMKEVLTPYIEQGIVVYKYYPGENMQLSAYNDCIKKHRNEMQWLAYIDTDEFIVPKEKDTIPEFLKDYEDCPGVVINWVNFDSNGHQTKPQGGVLENYTRTYYDLNLQSPHRVKSIVRPQKVQNVMSAHFAKYYGSKYGVTENKEENGWKVVKAGPSFTNTVSVKKIQINHYFSKSSEEYQKKCDKGRVILGSLRFNTKHVTFDDYKYDYSIYKHLIRLKPELKLRETVKYYWLKLKNIGLTLYHPFNKKSAYHYLNKKWYFKQYPAAKRSGLSALNHYNMYGWLEGNNPCPEFSTNDYIKEHPNLTKLGFNPLCHFLSYSGKLPDKSKTAKKQSDTNAVNSDNYVDLAVCAIMKNEAPYVKEWLDYHRLVGVKRFYIYDNGSTDNMKEILTPYIEQGIVVYKYYPGDARQIPAYNECLEEYRDKTQWLAFIDVDEFIVPKEKNSIPEFLKDYEQYSGVGINWIMFDSNGHREKPQGGVLNNYTRVRYDDQFSSNHHIKSIVKPKYVSKMNNVHFAQYVDNKCAVDEDKKEIRGVQWHPAAQALTDVVKVNKICINHYYCKSEREAQAKVAKGVATQKGTIKPIRSNQLNFPDYKYNYDVLKYVKILNPQIAKQEEIKSKFLALLNLKIKIAHMFRKNTLADHVNEKWYFEQYPEAKESGLSAIEHYMTIGWLEGKNPNSQFNTADYLQNHMNIEKDKVPPLLHYVTNGIKEHRLLVAGDASQPMVQKDCSVTVITPTYNRLQYLEKAINMLKAQTLKNIKFIIVDDGSKDGSSSYIEKTIEGDERFLLLKNNKNHGPSAARNKAFPLVDSEYIGFFDIDDEIPADYFEKLYQSAVKSNADIVFTNYNQAEHKIKSITNEADKYKALRNGAIWDKLYKTSLLIDNNIKFPEKLYTADNLFNIKAFNAAQKIELVDEPRYLYELHSDSIGKDKNLITKRKKDIITVCKKAMKFAKQKKFLPEIKIALQEFLSFSYSCYQDDKVFCDKLNTSLWGNKHHKAFYTAKTYSLKEYDLVSKSGYFNPIYYRWHNPCLWFSHQDLLNHYLSIGWLEGKNPSSEFDGNKYLKDYPDIDRAGVNPLIHYLGHGMSEHRANTPVVSTSEKIRYALEYPIRVKEEYDRLTAEIKALESMK